MDIRSVPFKYVPQDVRKELARLLDIQCEVFASDWTNLGAEVGLTFVEKMLLERKPHKHESNTLAFFEEWSKNLQNTVGKILDALEKIRRPHEVRILNEAKPEILECYFRSTYTDPFLQMGDKTFYPCDVSVDGTVSETSSLHDPYYLNSYQRISYPSNVFSEERNSRQPLFSIPDISSFTDSHFRQPDINRTFNDLALVDKNYNRTPHSFMPEKILNCGANKDKKETHVFVTYGNGNKTHDGKVFHLCQFLDKYFYCNVDLKHKRLGKSKVDDYFEKAHFVIICFDKEYMKSIQRFQSGQEEQPEELHTAYIFSKIKVEALLKGSNHRFVPLILKGGSVNNIPLFLNNKLFKWPEQYKDLLQFLSDP